MSDNCLNAKHFAQCLLCNSNQLYHINSLIFSASFTEEKGSQVFLAEPKNSKIFTVDRGKGAGRISISSEIGHLSIRFKPFPPKCAHDKTASGLCFLPACTPALFPCLPVSPGFSPPSCPFQDLDLGLLLAAASVLNTDTKGSSHGQDGAWVAGAEWAWKSRTLLSFSFFF